MGEHPQRNSCGKRKRTMVAKHSSVTFTLESEVPSAFQELQIPAAHRGTPESLSYLTF